MQDTSVAEKLHTFKISRIKVKPFSNHEFTKTSDKTLQVDEKIRFSTNPNEKAEDKAIV